MCSRSPHGASGKRAGGEEVGLRLGWWAGSLQPCRWHLGIAILRSHVIAWCYQAVLAVGEGAAAGPRRPWPQWELAEGHLLPPLAFRGPGGYRAQRVTESGHISSAPPSSPDSHPRGRGRVSWNRGPSVGPPSSAREERCLCGVSFWSLLILQSQQGQCP